MPERPGVVVGRNVRRLREARGMSGNALAGAADITQSYVSDLEAGKVTSPGLAMVQALARALGVAVDELLREPAQEPAPTEEMP